MKLRNLSIIIWGTLLFICILNFYLNFFRFPFFSINLFEAIPAQSALVIECNDVGSLNKLNVNSQFWNSIQKTSLFEKIKTDLFEVKNRLLKNEDSIAVFENNRFVAALQMSSAKSADFLYVIDASGMRLNAEKLIENLENVRVNQSVFLKEKVYELIFPDNQRFTICFYNSIIIVARFPFIVEDAIAQLNKPRQSLSDHEDFKLAEKSATGHPELSIYLNFKKLPQLLNRFSGQNNLNYLKSIGSLAMVNFYAEEFEVIFDGALIGYSDSGFEPGAIKPSESKMFEVIPDNCSFLFWQSKNFHKTLQFSDENDTIFTEYVEPWIGEEHAIFFMESRKSSLDDEQFIVFKLGDKDLAKQLLNDFAKSNGMMQDVDYQTFTIKRFFSDEILKPASLFDLGHFQSPFYTIIEDFIFFSNSKQSLEVLIDKHILNQTLSNDISYLQYQEELKASSNTFLYVNSHLYTPFLRQFTTELGHENTDDLIDIFYNFKILGIQLDRSEKLSKLDFYLDNSGKKTSPTKIIWNVKLAADAIIQPAVLANTKNGQKEIFVQDAENRIYLFDRNGKIVWERILKSPILSKIYQIQYYEDGESQILFNTKNQIYLIDHLGKDIGTYPLKLPSPATNGLCLIDFENDKQYQFFIGAQNGSVYGFKKTGEPLEGWNPKESVGQLAHDIQHFQLKGNDYILTLSDEGDFNVFKRNGEKRFETASFNTKYLSPPGLQTFKKNARIVLTNKSGKAQVFNRKGKHFNLYVGTGKDKNVKFLFADVLGDNRKDYVSLSGRNLSCYFYDKSDFNRSFNRQFEHFQDELFEVQFKNNEKWQIGTLNKSNKRINLLNNDGSLYDGFPLSGTTKFSIVDLFDANSNVLVVALDESIYTCKID